MKQQKTKPRKSYDLCRLLKSYENKWVALSPDCKRIVASADSLKKAAARVREDQREEVIFYKVLPFDVVYVPTVP